MEMRATCTVYSQEEGKTQGSTDLSAGVAELIQGRPRSWPDRKQAVRIREGDQTRKSASPGSTWLPRIPAHIVLPSPLIRRSPNPSIKVRIANLASSRVLASN